jgi:hypothetical protein
MSLFASPEGLVRSPRDGASVGERGSSAALRNAVAVEDPPSVVLGEDEPAKGFAAPTRSGSGKPCTEERTVNITKAAIAAAFRTAAETAAAK